MSKINEYIDIPDGKVEAFTAPIAKTHGNGEWMKAHAKRTGNKNAGRFFSSLVSIRLDRSPDLETSSTRGVFGVFGQWHSTTPQRLWI